MAMEKIDLNKVADNCASLSGKDKGLQSRTFFKLEELDNSLEPVDVLVPQYLRIISDSFSAGMFAASAVRLGSLDKFFDKYRFHASPRIVAQISESLSRAFH